MAASGATSAARGATSKAASRPPPRRHHPRAASKATTNAAPPPAKKRSRSQLVKVDGFAGRSRPRYRKQSMHAKDESEVEEMAASGAKRKPASEKNKTQEAKTVLKKSSEFTVLKKRSKVRRGLKGKRGVAIAEEHVKKEEAAASDSKPRPRAGGAGGVSVFTTGTNF